MSKLNRLGVCVTPAVLLVTQHKFEEHYRGVPPSLDLQHLLAFGNADEVHSTEVIGFMFVGFVTPQGLFQH